MSKATDNTDPLVERLTSEEGPDRVYYALGTLLDAQDFQDEQLYHRDRLARALAYLFGAGTAAGLRIGFKGTLTTATGTVQALPAAQHEIYVEPGLAIDAFGRLVELPRRACIRLARWIDYHRPKAADVSDDDVEKAERAARYGLLRAAVRGGKAITWLFVRFLPCERGKTPVIAEGAFDATNAVKPSRVRDGYELRLFLQGAPDTPPFARAPGNNLLPATRPALTDPPGSAARLAALQDAILGAWGDPASLKERESSLDENTRVAAGREREGWVLLGRVDVPVTVTADDVTYAVSDPVNHPVVPENNLRPFVYGAWALALSAGLPLPAAPSSVAP